MQEQSVVKFDFPAMEERILTFWKENKIFKKVLAKEAPKGRFVFYEGPPSANGMPGLHHVLPRIFKDAIPRYKTMQGYYVDRKAGWDTHGLPIELQVQKELGITSKKEIEKLKGTPAESIAYFNEKCREAVWRYKAEWERFTERIAFWIDLDHPYITYTNEYIESLWWIFREVWNKGLVYQDYKVVPYCPSCVTTLSSHEVAQGYDTVEEETVYVKFRWKDDTFFLVWTTTPWTLVGNVALAIGPDINYVKVQQMVGEKYEYLILAKSRLSVLKGDYEIIEEYKGSQLLNESYESLYGFFTKSSQKGWYLVPGDFVTTSDGTGIVHMAWYGEEDYGVIKMYHLPWAQHINAEGRVVAEVEPWKGMWFKNLDVEVLKDLRERSLLYKTEMYEHEYPFCWRCGTPLLYHATTSWFISVSTLRDELMKANETIHWVPDHIKRGRFGEWLAGTKDWAISRERYWGTPIPIWQCENCGKRVCIGSMEELQEKSGNLPKDDKGAIDLHRPFLDAITLPCEACATAMKRVPEVMDVWFDSGAMPFAQWHYPFENREQIDEALAFPADYISEAIDQTRGWFYTLLSISVLMKRDAPYKHVICLGHIRDKFGKKMSKSKGNVVNPWEVFSRYGSDPLRFHLFIVNNPGDYKNFDMANVDQVFKKVFLILLNVYIFYSMYEDRLLLRNEKSSHLLDRWILSRLASLNRGMTTSLEAYDLFAAAREIPMFIDDLSTWYVRRSRERFKSENRLDKSAAMTTLRKVLFTLSKLLAPFTPFFAEELFQRLKLENDLTESVHAVAWPDTEADLVDEQLIEAMETIRHLAAVILEKRASAKIPVRQILASATVVVKNERLLKLFMEENQYAEILREEVNVQEVKFMNDLSSSEQVVLDTTITEDLRALGLLREIKRHVNAMRKKAGLTRDDGMELHYETQSGALASFIENHKEWLLKETLAMSCGAGKLNLDTLHQGEVDIDGERCWFGLKISSTDGG
jgi:isoleucyl-tRNA synthetase